MDCSTRRITTFFLLSVLAGLTGREASADENPATWRSGEIIVTATRTPNPVSKLPVAVEVITREQIDESGALNLLDVLSEAEDVNALEPVNGRIGVARLRGLDSRLTLVLIDGYRVQAGFQGYADLREIPAGMIQRIEIIRGAGSALYGSDAVGGVINIITRQPSGTLHGGGTISGGESREGDAGTIQSDLWVSGTYGKIGFAVAGSYYDRDRYDRDPSDAMTDGDNRIIGSGSVSLTGDIRPGLRLTGGFVYADNQLDGIRTQTSGDFSRWVDSDRLMAHAGLELKTGAESTLSLQVSRTTYDWKSVMDNLDGFPTVTTATSGGTTTTTVTSSSSLTKVSQDAGQFDVRWSGRIADTHRLSAGVEYRTEEREDSGRAVTTKVVTKTGLVNIGPTRIVTPESGSISHDADNLGLYFQDEFTFHRPLSIITGLRYDEYSDFGPETSPKVAALLSLDEHLKIRASYAEGFRAPSLYELYTGSVTTKKSHIDANPDLDAERSKSWEVGADFSSGRFEASVTAFRNEIKGMISQVLTDESTDPDTYQFRNLSKAMTRGIEISATLRLPDGFSLSDRVSFLDSQNLDTGAPLLFVPDLSNIFRIGYANSHLALKGNIRVLTIGTQYISDTVKVEGYTLVNVYLAKRMSTSTELFAGVDNLFNDDANSAYGNNEGAGATGTWYYGGINFRF